MQNYQKLLDIALESAQKSEKIILKYFNQEIETFYKDDNSPVTIADKEAEQIIVNTISKNFPNHGFYGEEFGQQNSNAEYVWIIDPIDGTKNFRRGLPFFATQIALMKNEEIIVGVSNAPALNECLYATKNSGAFCKNDWSDNSQDKKIAVSKISEITDAFFQHESLKHFANNGYLEPLLALSQENMGFKGIGDAWSHHLLAKGNVDVVLAAKGKIWDFAALAIIIEEAGGKCSDFQGKKITKNIATFLSSNGLLHQKILNYFLK